MRRVVSAVTLCAVALAGCARSADEIAARPVPPALYAGLSCQDLNYQAMRLADEAASVARSQDAAAMRDAVAVGVGLVLFWPALFLLAAGDDKERLAQVKGEYAAVEQARLARGCTAPAAMIAAASAPMPSTETGAMSYVPPAPVSGGARPVEGARLADFSAEQMREWCGERWTRRTAADGRTEYNPCHAREMFR